MIDKEKQIEEMADTMCGSHSDYCERDGFPCEQGCRNGYLRAARRMYDAGYRKLEEHEWEEVAIVRSGEIVKRCYECPVCSAWCDTKEPLCPACCAKMSGGDGDDR